MISEIGSIISRDNITMLKMWEVNALEGKRPFQSHSHIQFEIAYIVEGKGTYKTLKNEYDFCEGDFFVFASNEVHSITSIDGGNLKLINLHIEPIYLLGRVFDSLSEENINLCFFHKDGFSNLLNREKTNNFKKYFMQLADELTKKDAEYPLLVKSFVNLMLVELLRNFDYIPRDNILKRSHISGIRKAVLYIESHLNEKITLEGIAQLVGVTPNYFSSLFHKFCNIRFQDYLNSRRIEKASQMLVDDKTDLNILDIAETCGFNNTANFNKAFKKQTGMTPSEYKRSYDIIQK